MNIFKENGRVFVFLKTLFILAFRLSKINPPEISLSYLKSRWLKNPFRLSSTV